MCNQERIAQLHVLLLQSVTAVLGSSEKASALNSLLEGAMQCIKAANLPEDALPMLESWLGPPEALAAYSTQRDIELMLVLRQIFPAGKVSH